MKCSKTFLVAATSLSLFASAGCMRQWHCPGGACAAQSAPKPRLLPWRRGAETTFQKDVAADPFPTAQQQGLDPDETMASKDTNVKTR
jgi:hypothetical protein